MTKVFLRPTNQDGVETLEKLCNKAKKFFKKVSSGPFVVEFVLNDNIEHLIRKLNDKQKKKEITKGISDVAKYFKCSMEFVEVSIE